MALTLDSGRRTRSRCAMQLFVSECFLLRMLDHFGSESLILKGGHALELRLERARATKDLDIHLSGNSTGLLDTLRELGRQAPQRRLRNPSTPNSKTSLRLTGCSSGSYSICSKRFVMGTTSRTSRPSFETLAPFGQPCCLRTWAQGESWNMHKASPHEDEVCFGVAAVEASMHIEMGKKRPQPPGSTRGEGPLEELGKP